MTTGFSRVGGKIAGNGSDFTLLDFVAEDLAGSELIANRDYVLVYNGGTDPLYLSFVNHGEADPLIDATTADLKVAPGETVTPACDRGIDVYLLGTTEFTAKELGTK